MKEEIIKILVWLHENNAWDLSQEIAKWVYNMEIFETHYVDSILWFLDTAIKLWINEEKQNILIEAYNKIQELRIQEMEEKKKQNIDNILDELF